MPIKYDETLAIRLSLETKNFLDDLATREHCTMSMQARHILEQYFNG